MGRKEWLLGRRGVTLLELIITLVILSVLAGTVLPLAEISVKRSKELELRRALRVVRNAIDEYKDDFGRAVEEKKIIPAMNDTGYPKTLDELVEGKDWGGLYNLKRKYLRRVPRDPLDNEELGWGLRSYADPPDSTVWGGEDIFDIYSQNPGTGLDGTPYQSW